MGQAAVVGVQCFPLAGLRRELVHLADLPAQALALALQGVLRLARLLQRVERLAPALPAACERAGVKLGVGIQQVAHRVRARQALPGVLAMDVEHALTQLAQLCRGRRAAIDPGAALALGVHGAPQQQGKGRIEAQIETSLFQPGPQRCAFIEFGTDVRAAGAFADQAGVGPRAGDQLEGIDHDGLARAGLAGEHGETLVELQVELADDHEVPQDDALEAHNPATPSFQCSFCRRVSK